MAENASEGPEINVTSDGGVTKVVLREGTGDCPPKHSKCLVHYVGTLVESDEVFMNTRDESSSQEPAQLVAGRDTLMREVGLHLALATMRKGELARVRTTPQYGFGERGSFSFPTVPPNAELEYVVELVDWEDVNEEKEARLMTYEERLEAAERRRRDGNELFKQGQYDEALSKYRLALAFLNEDFLLQLEGFHLEQAQGVMAPALLNMAACQLRQEDYHAAIGSCNQALAAKPGDAKALFRRGRARHLLGQTEAALDDLKRARAAAPSDAAVLQELQAVKAKLREDKQAQGQIFRGYFDKASGGQTLYEEEGGNPEASPSGSPAGGDVHEAAVAAAAPAGGWLAALLGWLWRPLHALFPLFFRAKPHAA